MVGIDHAPFVIDDGLTTPSTVTVAGTRCLQPALPLLSAVSATRTQEPTRKRTSRLPVLVVVALVALVLGSFGTAHAGGALTKGKVKSIAAKAVAKAAPELSVKSAATAANATNLNGQPASTYLDRSAQLQLPTQSHPLPSSTATELGTVALTVPNGVGFVHLVGTMSFQAGGTAAFPTLWTSADGTTCAATTGPGYDTRSYGEAASGGRDQIVQDLVVPATAGVHTYRLCGYAVGAGNSYWQASLTAETVAGGPTGAATGAGTGAGTSAGTATSTGSIDGR
ncbi:hypothetical protein G5V58_18605 [Nocardioides anomalus]|uniref:Uncharacterized protein n=1 Tax=Nocardioides anomalus TaxID=2712223 RepID=A0A6G6WH11_9ACTN|nr:hypothetical protein [Nocardioides anomalus]QIG44524.1 hypothetical protein G5V58_18605 [Nocardioides anomalus]